MSSIDMYGDGFIDWYDRRIPVERSTGAILAYRAWHMRGGSKIKPLVKYTELDRPMMKSDKKPTVNNPSGFYAVKNTNLGEVMHYHPEIFGRVRLYGRVIEHQYGYRAEYMMIDKLWVLPVLIYVPDAVHEMASGLMRQYACDVNVCQDLDGLLERIRNGDE